MKWFSLCFFLSLPSPAISNLSFHLSEDLLRLASSLEPIDQTKELNEAVRGGTLTGKARTLATTKIEIIPSRKAATYLLTLKGTTNSPEQTWVGSGVKLVSSLDAKFEVTKRIYFNGLKMECFPSEAAVTTQIAIKDGFGDKSARNVVAKTKAKRDKEDQEKAAADRISANLRDQLDTQTLSKVSEGGTLAELKGLTGGKNGDAQDIGLVSESTDTHAIFFLDIQGPHKMEEGELFVFPQDSDLGFEIHETAIHNLAQTKKAGRQETDSRIFSVFKLLMADEPYELRPHDRTDRWQFTYADTNPVQVSFRNGIIGVVVNGKGWQRVSPAGDVAQSERPFQLKTGYRLTRHEDRVWAVQEGPVQIGYLDPGMTADEEKELAFFRRKFAAFFEPTFKFEGLEIPAGSNLERFTTLRPSRLMAESGWLKLNWVLAPESK